jgi:putative ABC transport system substrate-binding protein
MTTGNRQQATGNSKIVKLFCFALSVFLIALCFSAEAQQPKNVHRIGYQSAGTSAAREEAFRQGLRELGYVEGQNIIIEWRFAQGKLDQVPRNAADLVRLKVDVIVTGGPNDTRAAKAATSTIPIVMTSDSDPVERGTVASLSRPGGNITGLADLNTELNGKRLELLKETLPRLSHVVALRNRPSPESVVTQKETEGAARSLGIQLQFHELKAPDDLNLLFDAVTKARPQALIVTGGPFGGPDRKRIVEFAAKRQLPAIYYRREFVEAGGLMSYDSSPNDLSRRAATYVDKILKGAKAAELPVEQPTKFELVINLKTAKQIGLVVPPNVLARADKVIR